MSCGGGCVVKDILDVVPGAGELFKQACRSPVDFQMLKEKILTNANSRPEVGALPTAPVAI